jgi:poly(3-hydroxybutyrate) depolymerase
MFERLITNLIVLEAVNPDRVYVMGYSAGGDGVYQLGPRMADHWAAAAAMAGHPNDAQPYSLRNIGFTIHVGELDTSYDRNLVAQQWSDQLDQLAAEDPGGYPHVVQIHAGKPHWMDLEDAVAVPWMAKFTRDPNPATVVWYQDDVTHTRFYWLAVDAAKAKAKTQVRATLTGQTIALASSDVTSLRVRLSDAMLDLDQPVVVTANGAERWNAKATRTIAVLAKTLEERGDPRMVWSAEVPVTL